MRSPQLNYVPFNNILYIGDEAKACIAVIEKFNARLLEIESHYAAWFNNRGNLSAVKDKLQHHIHYHFEGGIAIFKFKHDDDLPSIIRKECQIACKNLAAEQAFYLS